MTFGRGRLGIRTVWTTVFLVVSLAVLPSVDATSAPSRTAVAVVRGDVQIGHYLVKRDGTLDGAIRAFGQPSNLRGGGVICIARWRESGLQISFYNLGGQNPCERQFGFFGQAIITGRQWATAKGLRLGDPARPPLCPLRTTPLLWLVGLAPDATLSIWL